MDTHAVVYVSWGLWVADCPRPGCRGAEHYGHAPITGVVGGLTQQGFRCARCSILVPALWPDNAEDIWAVLSQRPVPETRNWRPEETLDDLIIENVCHGLMPTALVRGDGISIADGKIVGGARLAIGAA